VHGDHTGRTLAGRRVGHSSGWRRLEPASRIQAWPFGLGVERREEEADVYTLLDPAVLLDPKFYGDPFFDLNASFIGDEIPVAQELGRLMAPGVSVLS